MSTGCKTTILAVVRVKQNILYIYEYVPVLHPIPGTWYQVGCQGVIIYGFSCLRVEIMRDAKRDVHVVAIRTGCQWNTMLSLSGRKSTHWAVEARVLAVQLGGRIGCRRTRSNQ